MVRTRLGLTDDLELRADPWVLGLAEVMNFPGVVEGNPEVLDKLEEFRELVLDGHCPGLSGPALGAYCRRCVGWRA